jgi:hypothetical protein
MSFRFTTKEGVFMATIRNSTYAGAGALSQKYSASKLLSRAENMTKL